jgi:hypothetical protein
MATQKQIDELTAKIADLELQKTAIEEKISVAYGERLAAQRELNRNEKLTPAMRSALIRLANGAVLKSSDWRYPATYWIEDENGDGHESIRKSVFQGLASREAISKSEDTGAWRVSAYVISDHGRGLVTPEAKADAA